VDSKESHKGISNHFRREAKLMIGIFLFMLLPGLLAAVFVPKIKQFFAVDSCLDSGGAFDYNTHTCVGARRVAS